MWIIIDKLIDATTKAKKREQLIDEANEKIQRAKTYEDATDILRKHSNNMHDYAIELEFTLMCATVALLITVISLFMGVWL